MKKLASICVKSDRYQYSEAHGTGTPACDPIEAEAISLTFFNSSISTNQSNIDTQESKEEDILYVGSIKTVVGHTEGTAGLAAVLKASLALQHGIIPPNLLFNRLNPSVEPFYQHLKVLTTSK